MWGNVKLSYLTFLSKYKWQHPGNCLHDLLPPERDPSISHRLRHSTVYPIPQVRTKRHCSYENYSLKCYQWQPFMFIIAPFYFILFYVCMLYVLRFYVLLTNCICICVSY